MADPTTSTSTTTTTSSSTSTSTSTTLSTSTSTSTSTTSSTSTTTTLGNLSGTCTDKNSYAILGTACRVSIFGLAAGLPAGSVVATATSDSTDGSWSIASASLIRDTRYLVVFTLHQVYKGDHYIAGAEFKTAT